MRNPTHLLLLTLLCGAAAARAADATTTGASGGLLSAGLGGLLGGLPAQGGVAAQLKVSVAS